MSLKKLPTNCYTLLCLSMLYDVYLKWLKNFQKANKKTVKEKDKDLATYSNVKLVKNVDVCWLLLM